MLIAMLALVTLAASAQLKKDRNSAYSYWTKKDYVKAKEYIDKAVTYPEAATDAKVWFYRGSIYLDIIKSGVSSLLAPDAVSIAYESFQKAKALDAQEEYKQDIATNMGQIAGEFFNNGLALFKQSKFEEALPIFEKAASINAESGAVDTMALYASALCMKGLSESKPGMLDKAIAGYQSLADMKFKNAEIYPELSGLYLYKYDNGDKTALAKAKSALETGKSLFPTATMITLAEGNIFLKEGDFNKAIESYNAALKVDPQNAAIYSAIGSSYDELQKKPSTSEADKELLMKQAIEFYSKAIELKPDMYDAIFNLGSIYYNRGAEVITQANSLPPTENDLYDKMIKKGNDYLNQALPQLEKYHEMQPQDSSVIGPLKEIYVRLKLNDKLEKLKGN